MMHNQLTLEDFGGIPASQKYILSRKHVFDWRVGTLKDKTDMHKPVCVPV